MIKTAYKHCQKSLFERWSELDEFPAQGEIMSIKAATAVVTLSFAMAACSKNLIESRQRNEAPHSQKDAGIVLEKASAAQVESILENHPEAQVRVVSPEHGLYEIFGVSEEILRQEYDGASSKNHFYELKQPLLTAIKGPKGLQAPGLNECAEYGAIGPVAKLEVTQPTDITMFGTINSGTPISFSAKGSQGRSLKSIFVVTYPESTGGREEAYAGDTLNVDTTALGLYTVIVVVQDSSNVCSLDGFRFVVTANRQYDPSKAANLRLNLDDFSHLAEIHAQESWLVSRGDGITIAVIDTGVNYNHPSLAGKIEINKNEIGANQIDDDHNGFVDDVYGYDMLNGDSFAYDDDSHGTHVAGLAAARQFGMAQNAKILPIKALNSIGGDSATIAGAIRYAADRGAKIINLSLGIEQDQVDPVTLSAVNYAQSKGCLIVAAAGNGDPDTGRGFDIDQRKVFPASIENNNLLTVAAFDKGEALSPYSNFGHHSVGIVAPGGGPNGLMVSAAGENPEGRLFIPMAGTSMAAPVIAGIAAQVWSRSPNLSAPEVKQILMNSGPKLPELENMTITGRHTDALSAVKALEPRNVLL